MPTVLLVTIPAVLFVLGAWLPFTFFIRPLIPSRVVNGLKFFFKPLNKLYFEPAWAKGFDEEFVARYLSLYALKMPAAFAEIGVQTSAADLLRRAAKVKCVVSLGSLTSIIPTALSDDNKAVTLTGLTYSETSIGVGVLADMGMLDNGLLKIDHTAFTYEFHNAMIMGLAGYNVAIAESFVSPTDPRIQSIVGGDLATLKAKRATLDIAYDQIKV